VQAESLGCSLSLGEEILLVVGSGPNSAGWLIAVEGDTWERIDSLDSGGIAVAEEHLYRLLCTRSNETSPATGEMLVYDESGVAHYHRIEGLDDPHALIWDGEYLLAPCPAVNQIFWLGLDGAVKRTWKAPGTADAWHVNGVHVHQGRLYASAFGRFTGHYGWSHDMDAPVGLIFDVETQRDVVTGLCCPHDPVHVDGGWLVCNSRVGDLLFIDGAGAVARKAHLGGWTRGLALTDRYIFTGLSAERHYTGEPGHGELVVLDRKTWATVARIPMPCMEMQILSLVPRKFLRALRRGFRTNATRVSAQDREDMFRSAGNIHPDGKLTRMDQLAPEDCRCTVTAKAPAEVIAGSGFPAEVEVTNCGPVTLLTTPPRPINLGYRWVGRNNGTAEPQVDYLRFPLERALPPGGKWKWQVSILAPLDAGAYDLVFSLVQEWVAWFDQLHAPNGCTLRVNVKQEN